MGKEILRAKKIIERDRLGLCYGSEDVIRRDIENLLSEYFSLTKHIEVKLIKENDKIKILIEGECSGVKKFITLGC